MKILVYLVYFQTVLSVGHTASESGHSVHFEFLYPYEINAQRHKFEGRICSDMELYALVPIEPENLEEELVGGACVTYLEEYLKVEIRNVTSIPNDSGTNNSLSNTTLSPHDIHHSKQIDLPEGLEFDVVNSDLVDIDDAYYLIVSKPDILRDKVEIQFYVVLVRTSDHKVMSNPLPFAIRVDHPPDEGRPNGAALFAGVLVMVTVLIALLIPVTVCVKRRRKAGKPVCHCGNPPPNEEKAEVKIQVNDGFISDTRDARSNSTASFADPKQTIGSHQLSSVSDFHFQPKWFDPHYKEHEGTPGTERRISVTPVTERQISVTPTTERRISVVQEECRL